MNAVPTSDGVWPPPFDAAALLSFDLDGESWLLGADERNECLPITRSQAAYGATYGVFEILRLLQRFEFRATFFVPAWIVERHPDAVAAIIDGDHEIGMHGYLHECPARLTPVQERDILRRSREIIQTATGTVPTGYRAPDGEISEHTLEILAEAGVQYASMFLNDVFPYFHQCRDGYELLELPIQWSCDDWQYSMVSPFALPEPEVFPIATPHHIFSVWEAELSGICGMGGLFVLINHPQVTGRPGRITTLERLLQLLRDNSSIWVATGEEINRYWRDARPLVPTGRQRLARRWPNEPSRSLGAEQPEVWGTVPMRARK